MHSMRTILVKLPSRERPQKFMRSLKATVDHADDPKSLHFLFSFDLNDESMWGIADEIAPLGVNADIHFGVSKSKIHAVNRDMESVTEPWEYLVVLSDDMICEHKGWDTLLRKEFAEHLPDGDGILWHFDGAQTNITTLPIMGRTYYERDGYIYHSSYKSTHCDQEQTDVAQARGRIMFSDIVIWRHWHPAWKAGVIPDDLHERNELAWHVDEANYGRRKAKGFPR